MTTINRVASGIPTGGQFAANSRDEAPAGLLTSGITTIILDAPDAHGGFDEIRTSESGMTCYFLGGKLHNEAGPAIDAGPSAESYGQSAWINGMLLTPLEDELHFDGMVDDEGVNTQVWARGDNVRVYITPDGRTTFTRDGDVERAGAPAITGGHGPDLWFRHGTAIDNPIPAEPTVTHHGSGHTAYAVNRGANYVEGATATETAKKVREHLKEAVFAGVLGENVGVLAEMTVKTKGRPGVVDKPQVLHVEYRPEHNRPFTYVEIDEHGAKTLTEKGRRVAGVIADVVSSHNIWESGPGAHRASSAFSVVIDVI